MNCAACGAASPRREVLRRVRHAGGSRMPQLRHRTAPGAEVLPRVRHRRSRQPRATAPAASACADGRAAGDLGAVRRSGRVHDAVRGARSGRGPRAARPLLRHRARHRGPLRRDDREVHRRRRHGGVGRADRARGRRRTRGAGRARPGRRGGRIRRIGRGARGWPCASAWSPARSRSRSARPARAWWPATR